MSKSIIINGADFSQNGFKAPITLSFETVFGSEGHDTFLVNTNDQEYPDWKGLREEYFMRDYGEYPPSELRVGRINVTGFSKLKVKFQFFSGGGLGYYLFADLSKICLTTPSESVIGSDVYHNIDEEIVIPSQAKYFYCTFDPSKEYSFIGLTD